MAFEEFRQRQRAGENPAPADYRRRFGVESNSWPPARARNSPAPDSSSRGAPPFQISAEEGTSNMERAASVYLQYRRQGGDGYNLASHLTSYQVPAEQADFLQRLDQSDPHAAERLAEAFANFPQVGERFLGFQICGELGRGAFGRVFLARQGDLAHRLVALKVSADIRGESFALAQLQHTNVVPIYSVHRSGLYQAVCMPYLARPPWPTPSQSSRFGKRCPTLERRLLATLTSAQTRTPMRRQQSAVRRRRSRKGRRPFKTILLARARKVRSIPSRAEPPLSSCGCAGWRMCRQSCG